MTSGEAADLLGVSIATVKRIRDEDLPPVMRIGRRGDRRYRRADVEALKRKWQGDIDALLATVAAITDPAERAREALSLLDSHRSSIPNADELRDQAAAELKRLGQEP